ncbi:hypothetical protein E8F12_19475 [Pseudomonas sp. BN102]|nr:hypothetical protein [Pseudomonas sp. BN102]
MDFFLEYMPPQAFGIPEGKARFLFKLAPCRLNQEVIRFNRAASSGATLRTNRILPPCQGYALGRRFDRGQEHGGVQCPHSARATVWSGEIESVPFSNPPLQDGYAKIRPLSSDGSIRHSSLIRSSPALSLPKQTASAQGGCQRADFPLHHRQNGC